MQPMKTPQDRAALVARLLVAWERAPEKRLGELITGGLDAATIAGVFAAGDEQLVGGVEAFVKGLARVDGPRPPLRLVPRPAAEREPEANEDRRPVIRINIVARVNVDAAVVALRDGASLIPWVVYLRGGVLLQDIDGETRPFPAAMMPELLCYVARWEKQNRRGERKPADPPAIVWAVMRRAAEWAPSKDPTDAR
jgi:hypothetical protein